MEQLSPRLMNWTSILDPQTREQAFMTSKMPFIHPWLALMPDAHLGKGATVGSVIPTTDAIIPAAVGVDVGCGMIAVQTQWSRLDLQNWGGDLTGLHHAIEREVPLSAGRYNNGICAWTAARRIKDLEVRAEKARFDPDRYAPNWRLQLGTLGGGNHFIEVTIDETDTVWAFLHSGSRGIGNKIANFHIKKAQELCRRWHVALPHPDLAYLVTGTDEFSHYVRELNWAQRFALLNREVMMDRVLGCLGEVMNELPEERQRINCHHNFTQQERHYGRDVWVSRKGAIEARESQLGLIPGSMGTASYVVRGRGNRQSLCSSPHGAGRQHSRSAAKRLFTQDSLREAMHGIMYRDDAAFVDEHPDAYKPIDRVMADSADLIEVVHTFHQVINVKGQ